MQLIEIDYGEISAGRGLAELDRACREWGFFELKNHPFTMDMRMDMLQAMDSFFALSTDQKRHCERTAENHWGFYDRELTKNVRDWKELFDVGPAFGQCMPQWPANLPGFQQSIEAHYAVCETVAIQLVRSVGAALGDDGDALAQGFEDHTSYLRLNHYPLCANPSPADTPTGPPHGHFGISHHSDAGAVTVLLQDGQAGLQVEKDGRWYSVAAGRGSIIINIGDVVQVWSNDRYKAPLHRVLASDTHTRYSAPFFLNPAFQTDYAPLASTHKHGAARYRPINWGEFRNGRAAGDYADVGEEIQISHYRV